MFGTWRLLLAFEVVLAHLLNVTPLGGNAVFSFFVLSGFLMTAIMQKSYGYTSEGRMRFVVNRALRLLPSYWFAAVIALLLVFFLGAQNTVAYHRVLDRPATALEWFENLFMLFLSFRPIDVEPRLVPATWALTVEIVYYALICLGVSRTERRSRYWFLGSLAWVVAMLASGADRTILYGTIASGSFPFAAGALAWHKRAAILGWLDRLRIGAVGMVGLRWLYLLLFYEIFRKFLPAGIPVRELSEVGTALLSIAVVVRLFSVSREHPMGRIDEVLGAYSYPVYLLHWCCGLIGAVLVYGMPIAQDYRTLPVFLAALPILFLLSSVCVFAIDRRVNRLRDRNRRREPLAEAAREAQSGLAVAP